MAVQQLRPQINLLQLFWRLLRYRVAVMLLLFMLLGAARHADLGDYVKNLVLATVALAFSYVSATSSNDLADQEIDELNHPASPGRPLVNGMAGHRDMWLMFGLASLAAIASACFINWRAGGLLVLSVLLNVAYSLPPLRVSYRTFLAPLVLGLAYVGVPSLLGSVSVHGHFNSRDGWWLAGLYIMFVGRICLKDFRDRKGDAAFHKPTFLLRFGKATTCKLSGICVVVGGLLITSQLQKLWLQLLTLAFVACILAMLVRLAKAPGGSAEQISIGVGAKMGNGLLITLLCYGIVARSSASVSSQALITILVALLFFVNLVAFLAHPERATISYKG